MKLLTAEPLRPGTCNVCVDSQTGQRRFESPNIPNEISTAQAKERPLSEDADISWSKDIPGYDSTHQTGVNLEELYNRRRRDISETFALKRRFLWDSGQLNKNKGLFSDTNSFLSQGIAYKNVLDQLRVYGIAFLRNIPNNEEAVERIATHIGPLRNTFYGRTWNVRDDPASHNIAYTSQELPLHMDLLYEFTFIPLSLKPLVLNAADT